MTKKFLGGLSIICVFFSLGIFQVAAADVVTGWNSVALDAIRTGNTPPPAAARNLAIMHASIYDAVNGIRRSYKPYFVTSAGPAGASIEAASSAAARRVLLSLYPSLQSTIEAAYQSSLRRISGNNQTTQAIQWGESVAGAILQWRSTDGSSNTVAYTPGSQPGQWRPTISFGGVVRPALLRSGAPFFPSRSRAVRSSGRRYRLLSAVPHMLPK